jgi:hypothetical protein
LEDDNLTPESQDESADNPRRGSARERQRRRRERQSREAPPSRNVRQVVTGPRISLPNLRNMPLGRLRLVAAAAFGVVVVLGVIVFLRGLKPPEPEVQPHAIWIGTEWTYEAHEAGDIETLAQQLKTDQIGTVYAWVSWLQEDRTWRGAENFTAVRDFATQLKAQNPELTLYGWIGFPVELGPEGYRLDDEELQDNIADFSASIVNELGYDGIFLTVEQVWDGDENFLALLRKVRASLGDDVPIAVAIPPDWSPIDAGIPVPPLIVPGTIWAEEYKQSVTLLSDQMAVMAYNSGLTSAADYVQWVAYQVETYAKAVNAIGAGTELIIGIPSYDAAPPGHDPEVENVTTALEGVKSGLALAGDAAQSVRGVAIYAWWTTEDEEWSEYRSWLTAN